jgi:Ca-activated chloride channel homolog
MTFDPILPVWALSTVAVILVAVRMAALYRVLVRTGPGRYRQVVLRWAGLTLAVLLLLVAAARPGLTPDKGPAAPPAAGPTSANLNVFFVVDRSVDERVEDFADKTSRMAGIRDDITALAAQYPRARFAIIGFAAKAALHWPLSDDTWGFDPLVAGLSTYTDVPLDAAYQVDPTAADAVLNDKLAQAAKDFPGSKSLVFYLGSGAGQSRSPRGDFDAIKPLIAGGAVLGYGTTAGGPIPQGFVGGDPIFYADQQTGQVLNSSIDEDSLRQIATQLGVSYHHREKGQPITPVIPAVDPGAVSGDSPVEGTRTVERTELYWLFTALAAALILAEIYLTIRDVRHTRSSRKEVVPS